MTDSNKHPDTIKAERKSVPGKKGRLEMLAFKMGNH